MREHKHETDDLLCGVIATHEHDGFASDGLDAEPTVSWPRRFIFSGAVTAIDRWNQAQWNDLVMRGGPPLYGIMGE